jgi:hypothetical protein
MAIPFNATGPWPSANFGDAPKYARGIKGGVFISPGDTDILRRLASRLAQLAARPSEAGKRELWYQQLSRGKAQPGFDHRGASADNQGLVETCLALV